MPSIVMGERGTFKTRSKFLVLPTLVYPEFVFARALWDKTSLRCRSVNRVMCLSLYLVLACFTDAVYAHSTERGLVMLLPTGYYVAGGGIAVLASFLMLACIPQRWLSHAGNCSLRLVKIPAVKPFWPSIVSFLLLGGLIYAGFRGSTDPLSNPLVLWIWTMWWVGFTALQCVTGSLWTHLNPWSGPVALLRWITGIERTPCRLPDAVGYFPALILFFCFAWFELVYPAPDDPSRLATVVFIYWIVTSVGIILFGEKDWFSRAEPFAIFFSLIGNCSPLVRRSIRDAQGRTAIELRLSWPGVNFLLLPPLPVSGILFVLLTLSSVSFDGLSRTFAWLSLIEVNPLEYPGRTAVVFSNSIGLVAAFVSLTAAFVCSVYAGCRLIGRNDVFLYACGRLVYSIIPISLAFHLAHYMTLFLTNIQYVVIALSDPFDVSWDLLGTSHWHVTTSFLNNIDSVSLIWQSQTLIVVAGHIIGIGMAHCMATQLFTSNSEAVRSQVFLAVLMVLYTVFGLWLLSTASIG